MNNIVDTHGTFSTLIDQSASEMTKGMQLGTFSAQNLIAASLERAHKINRELNAFCYLFDDLALEKAALADAALEKGKTLGPLSAQHQYQGPSKF